MKDKDHDWLGVRRCRRCNYESCICGNPFWEAERRRKLKAADHARIDALAQAWAERFGERLRAALASRIEEQHVHAK